MKFNKLSILRFLNCFIGSGKTTVMLRALQSTLEEGKKCAVLVCYRSLEKQQVTEWLKSTAVDASLINNVEFIRLSNLLDMFAQADVPDNTDEHFIAFDTCFVNFRTLDIFKDYDQIFISHECYEFIIRHLVDELESHGGFDD